MSETGGYLVPKEEAEALLDIIFKETMAPWYKKVWYKITGRKPRTPILDMIKKMPIKGELRLPKIDELVINTKCESCGKPLT